MYYPIFVSGDRVRCGVVGGGTVAERKVRTLLETGAKVRVISPKLTPALVRMAARREFEWHKAKYKSVFLGGLDLVFGATNDPAVNARIFRDALRRRLLVNIVDDPEHCSFIVPATCRKGNIQVAVSTGGGAPMIAGKIRSDILGVLGGAYPPLVAWLKSHRDAIKALPGPRKRLFWEKMKKLDVHRITAVAAKILAEAKAPP